VQLLNIWNIPPVDWGEMLTKVTFLCLIIINHHCSILSMAYYRLDVNTLHWAYFILIHTYIYLTFIYFYLSFHVYHSYCAHLFAHVLCKSFKIILQYSPGIVWVATKVHFRLFNWTVLSLCLFSLLPNLFLSLSDCHPVVLEHQKCLRTVNRFAATLIVNIIILPKCLT